MQGLLSSQGVRARRATAWLVTGVLLVALAGISAAPVSAATGSQAPGAHGQAATWSPGDKDGFGTARTTASKVWYTLNDGALSEVFFPRIDTPAT
jgi:glucoamylase